MSYTDIASSRIPEVYSSVYLSTFVMPFSDCEKPGFHYVRYTLLSPRIHIYGSFRIVDPYHCEK